MGTGRWNTETVTHRRSAPPSSAGGRRRGSLRYVTEGNLSQAAGHEEQMIKSCQAANENAGVLKIEEWDGLADPAHRADGA